MTQPIVVSRRRWLKVGLVVWLVAIATFTLRPDLPGGPWPWSPSLPTPTLQPLRALLDQPLTLDGWEGDQRPTSINGQRWSLNTYVALEPSALQPSVTELALLLRPQRGATDQPSVEWVDLQGAQNWQTSRPRFLTLEADSASVRGRYFQARGERQTLAVLQWYAWPQGGDASPSGWFWADQRSQWQQRQRTPWVAVCLLIPVEPSQTATDYAAAAAALAQQVQTQLQRQIFEDSP